MINVLLFVCLFLFPILFTNTKVCYAQKCVYVVNKIVIVIYCNNNNI